MAEEAHNKAAPKYVHITDDPDQEGTIFDVVIIGGGVVGLATLRAATLQGWSCALVEREDHLLSHASGSNSGIACTGVDATPGTLERALIRDSISQMRLYCKDHNIPVRPCGSLVCLWPGDDEQNLQLVLAESHDAGDTHASRLTPEEVKAKEPNLHSACRGAVHIPGEVVVDPWLLPISYAAHARENGAKVFTSFCFDAAASTFQNDIWTVVRTESDTIGSSESGTPSQGHKSLPPSSIRSKAVVNCAGLWADIVQSKAQGHSLWQAKPRRGQYRVYNSNESTRIHHPIQPCPTQFTKGIFVFGSLYDQIIVGPTALDQESRTDRTIDPKVADELDVCAKRIVPEIRPTRDIVGQYVGVRPGSDKRDYQIHLHARKHWIAVASIRSTGLTASLGIGNYVTRQLNAILGPCANDKTIATTGMPAIHRMVQEFHDTGGFVTLHGHKYRVTHPITKLGWQHRTGLAAIHPKM